MKICLIRPSRLVDLRSVSVNPTPPLGLAFIAGSLTDAGHHVTVIDAIAEDPLAYHKFNYPLKEHPYKSKDLEHLHLNGLRPEDVLLRIPVDTQLIGVSCMFTNSWLSDRFLINFLKSNLPDITIVAGGESITALPEFFMKDSHGIDICVLGEGEETMVNLVFNIENQLDLSLVDGICFKEIRSEKIINNPRRSRKKEIEKIPLPDWDLFPLEAYEKYNLKYGLTNRKSLPIMATRGCPYRCTFCSSPSMWGTSYMMRTPSNVVDEIEMLMNRYGVTNFDFYDLTAIIKKQWIIEFSNEIIKRKLDITYQIPAGTRSEAIDKEVAENLFKSGCKNITYAPESGSERLLKLIKKKVKLPNMLVSLDYSNKAGISVMINMIFGLPGETHTDIWKTILFLIKCSWVGVPDISPSLFQPYPGSEIFDDLIEKKKIDLEKDEYFLEIAFVATYGKAKYYNEHVHRYWYLFYEIFIIVVFIGSNYLFRPFRAVKAVRNIITENYEYRFERAVGKIFHVLKRRIKAIPVEIRNAIRWN
jgi:anaerobic magnesium-protoporphyrin IX monomethyl ester cyclase